MPLQHVMLAACWISAWACFAELSQGFAVQKLYHAALIELLTDRSAEGCITCGVLPVAEAQTEAAGKLPAAPRSQVVRAAGSCAASVPGCTTQSNQCHHQTRAHMPRPSANGRHCGMHTLASGVLCPARHTSAWYAAVLSGCMDAEQP